MKKALLCILGIIVYSYCIVRHIYIHEQYVDKKMELCKMSLHNPTSPNEQIGYVYNYETGQLMFTCFLHSYYVIPILWEKNCVNIAFSTGESVCVTKYTYCDWINYSFGYLGIPRLNQVASGLLEYGNCNSHIPFDGHVYKAKPENDSKDGRPVLSSDEVIGYVVGELNEAG